MLFFWKIVGKILRDMNREGTGFKGEGPMSHPRDMIYTTPRMEDPSERKEPISPVDPEAFRVINVSNEVLGRRPEMRKVCFHVLQGAREQKPEKSPLDGSEPRPSSFQG